MVGAYFADLKQVLAATHRSLSRRGSAWVVVGDSRYGGTHIPTAKILTELVATIGFTVDKIEPFRSMRVSAQQGGRPELAETLLVLARR